MTREMQMIEALEKAFTARIGELEKDVAKLKDKIKPSNIVKAVMAAGAKPKAPAKGEKR